MEIKGYIYSCNGVSFLHIIHPFIQEIEFHKCGPDTQTRNTKRVISTHPKN